VSTWQTGEFDRAKISSVFHPFLPAHAAKSLHDVDLAKLWARGKRLILVDVDHTLVKWRQEEFSPEVLGWLAQAKQMGFELCIISNTKRVERLGRLSEKLDIPTVRGRFKPSRAMFRLALAKFKRKAAEAIMIGDQIFTDVLGANRAGIDAIWVQKMEGPEFRGTAINRFMERLLTGSLYRALVVTESHPPAIPGHPIPAERTVVQQGVRFLIVGGTSFVIDTGLTFVFMRIVHVDGRELGSVFGEWLMKNAPTLFGHVETPDKAAAYILGGLASFFAMFNSFVWNRLWTFEAQGQDRRSRQMIRFYTVSVLGALLNANIFGQMYEVIPAHPAQSILLAKVVSAAVVAVWNFLGMRYFVFPKSR